MRWPFSCASVLKSVGSLTNPMPSDSTAKISAQDLNVYYGSKQALFDVNLNIPPNQVTALIGPSGCGKSTFLRCINRMNDTIEGCRIEGRVIIDDMDIN